MKFDWDEKKARENIKNHGGVAFEEASAVFDDLCAIEKYDTIHSEIDEQRFTRIGFGINRILRVTYTIRFDEDADEIIRMISARIAVGYEKREYERYETKFEDS